MPSRPLVRSRLGWGQCLLFGCLHHGAVLRECPAHATALHHHYPWVPTAPKHSEACRLCWWGHLGASRALMPPCHPSGFPPHSPPTLSHVPLFPHPELQLSPRPWGASAAAVVAVAPRCHPAWPQQTPPASPPRLLRDGEQPPAASSRSWGQILASLALPLGRIGMLRGTVTVPWRGQNILFFPISALYTRKLLACMHTSCCVTSYFDGIK